MEYESRTRRFTRAEYDRLIELGVFQPDEDIELIGGELIVAEPQGAPHYTAIRKTAKALEAAFGPGWDVRMEGPIGLDDESEPEPDVAVVPGSLDDYAREHPSRPVLTVEIAESSLALDRLARPEHAELDEPLVLGSGKAPSPSLVVHHEPIVSGRHEERQCPQTNTAV